MQRSPTSPCDERRAQRIVRRAQPAALPRAEAVGLPEPNGNRRADVPVRRAHVPVRRARDSDEEPSRDRRAQRGRLRPCPRAVSRRDGCDQGCPWCSLLRRVMMIAGACSSPRPPPAPTVAPSVAPTATTAPTASAAPATPAATTAPTTAPSASTAATATPAPSASTAGRPSVLRVAQIFELPCRASTRGGTRNGQRSGADGRPRVQPSRGR